MYIAIVKNSATMEESFQELIGSFRESRLAFRTAAATVESAIVSLMKAHRKESESRSASPSSAGDDRAGLDSTIRALSAEFFHYALVLEQQGEKMASALAVELECMRRLRRIELQAAADGVAVERLMVTLEATAAQLAGLGDSLDLNLEEIDTMPGAGLWLPGPQARASESNRRMRSHVSSLEATVRAIIQDEPDT